MKCSYIRHADVKKIKPKHISVSKKTYSGRMAYADKNLKKLQGSYMPKNLKNKPRKKIT